MKTKNMNWNGPLALTLILLSAVAAFYLCSIPSIGLAVGFKPTESTPVWRNPAGLTQDDLDRAQQARENANRALELRRLEARIALQDYFEGR